MNESNCKGLFTRTVAFVSYEGEIGKSMFARCTLICLTH